MSESSAEILTAPYRLKYSYKRTTGPVIGRFLTDLRDGKITGVRRPDGAVMVPPREYDPETGEALSEFVSLPDTGVVTGWTWVAEPRQLHAMSTPFAFATIQLDGAHTGMLHRVVAPDESVMRSGMRVRARWAAERVGMITDIECFVPEESA